MLLFGTAGKLEASWGLWPCTSEACTADGQTDPLQTTDEAEEAGEGVSRNFEVQASGTGGRFLLPSLKIQHASTFGIVKGSAYSQVQHWFSMLMDAGFTELDLYCSETLTSNTMPGAACKGASGALCVCVACVGVGGVGGCKPAYKKTVGKLTE